MSLVVSRMTESVSTKFSLNSNLCWYYFARTSADPLHGFVVAPPNSLQVGPPGGGGGGSSSHRKRRTLVAPEMNLSLDQSEGSLLSDDFLDTPDDLDINVDDIDTPDETDSLEFITNGNDLEWEGG